MLKYYHMKAVNREFLTSRELEEFKQELTVAEKQADYGLKIKNLELELKKIETKWTQVYRIPFAIIMLPVRILFAFGYIAHAIRKTEPSKDYWEFLKSL